MNQRAIALLYLISATCAAESRALEQAELELPITGEKRIIAHYMTGEVFFDGAQVPDNILPAMADTVGVSKSQSVLACFTHRVLP